jgi:hypothetical protein
MAELVRRPAWIDTWLFILITWLATGAWFLSTDVGRQAIVDERVRVTEAFGSVVDDAQYVALQANPPWWTYFTSGGRLLITPEITLLVAAGVWIVGRKAGTPVSFPQGLAIVVHATVVLWIGQLAATPFNYVRESLTTPFNLAAILPLMEDGTVATRFFGTLDVFVLWWLGLLAIGLSVLTGRSARRYTLLLMALYVGFAAVVAGTIAALGGI